MPKHVLNPIPIATAQSLSSSFNSASTTVPFQDNLSYQVTVTTSDSVGEFFLQGSDDDANWADTGNSLLISGANDTLLFAINQWPFKYVRLRYASSVAGTGTCSILFHARTVGA